MSIDPDKPIVAPRILIVDDDYGIRAALSDFLGQNGYSVESAANGRAMDQKLAMAAFDLVILDLMLPGEDGLSLCRRLNTSGGPPIIMLSAMGQDTDRIVGLEVGADDYLAKPCNPRELLARVRAVLRRAKDARNGQRGAATYLFQGWALDALRRELRSPDNVLVTLSGTEFSVLHTFLSRPQRILTRDQLLDAAHGANGESFDRAIDVQISRLRRKLRNASDSEELIQTVRNEGYMFTAKVTRR